MATKKIDKLTPEQEAQINVYRDMGIEIGLATGPTNREVATRCILEIYKFLCQPAPEQIVFAKSPKAAQHLANYFLTGEAGLSHKEATEKCLSLRAGFNPEWNDEWVKTILSLTPVKKEFRDTHSYGYGSNETYWTCFYKYFQNVLGIDFTKVDSDYKKMYAKEAQYVGIPVEQLPQHFLDVFYDLAKHSGWHYIYKGMAIVCDRPTSIFMENRVLHNEEGPAVEYADGFKIWIINGTSVTEQIVMHPETLTIEQIKAESDMEKKRIMIQRFGPQLYLTQINAIVLDHDSLGFEGSADRALLASEDGDKWLVGSDGSTGRIYFMNVPKEAMTCRQAHQMISGLNEDLCRGEC